MKKMKNKLFLGFLRIVLVLSVLIGRLVAHTDYRLQPQERRRSAPLPPCLSTISPPATNATWIAFYQRFTKIAATWSQKT
jgi:hypothetical protein